MFALKSRAAWSKHWRRCVWLTCPTRCSKRTARQLPRCGTGARAKSIYCDSSSFGPALFEICWPDIYLGGPYGPVKDQMYWPELVRRSEKCAGPAGQCLCRGLRVTQPSKNITERRLNWYGRVMRRDEEHRLRKVLRADIPGKRKRGRPKTRWKDACTNR